MQISTATVLLFVIAGLRPVIAETPPAKPPLGVPADARYFNHHWYRLYLDKATWRQARGRCEDLHGQLVVIPDAATQDFVRKVADGRQIWLGATNEHSQHGKYKWVDGTDLTFQAWDHGQPSGGNEHFLEIWKKDGSWNDGVLNDAYVVGYICEWKG
ncbi:C-type lectin domain protein [Chthoniobacter flavus Ellin428]|uniref:C-type lectin domain protein n=1 Tax=Chthoniobacter flavus Ellin428 TaxID=497964 RepID=B4D3D6_9BACT|nr:lectin-like protein [Chthoniobacter flavus]EDY19247.1 C-type lectin domain protein [Chthoniobacter flavus Ellin428]TCO88090.1 lectin-like protein [Chthoniobacter flavus]